LLAAAKHTGINWSVSLERALQHELAVAKRKEWRAENREAIEAYNEHVEQHGPFSDYTSTF
jgi:antitoxin CcdA